MKGCNFPGKRNFFSNVDPSQTVSEKDIGGLRDSVYSELSEHKFLHKMTLYAGKNKNILQIKIRYFYIRKF
jgi:hypothetical protein